MQVMQVMQMLQLLLANLIFLTGILQIHAQTQTQNVNKFGIRQQYLMQVMQVMQMLQSKLQNKRHQIPTHQNSSLIPRLLS